MSFSILLMGMQAGRQADAGKVIDKCLFLLYAWYSVLFPGGGVQLKPNGSGYFDTAMMIYDYFLRVYI
jgi:hypothetical protein